MKEITFLLYLYGNFLNLYFSLKYTISEMSSTTLLMIFFIIFSHACFSISTHYRISGKENPKTAHENSMHPLPAIVWCGFWVGRNY